MQVVDDGGVILLDGCFIPYGRCPQNAEEFITVARVGIENCSRRSLELEQRIASLSIEEARQEWRRRRYESVRATYEHQTET
jgi:hypothetical protein